MYYYMLQYMHVNDNDGCAVKPTLSLLEVTLILTSVEIYINASTLNNQKN